MLRSSNAVESFLPASGTAGILARDHFDPTSTSAGIFAGHLAAAKFNVVFDDGGALDDRKARTDLHLGDLVLVSGVDTDLLGWTVRDLIDLSEQAISGALGDDGFDIRGDAIDDITVQDLSDALSVINLDFDNGTQYLGNLGLGS